MTYIISFTYILAELTLCRFSNTSAGNATTNLSPLCLDSRSRGVQSARANACSSKSPSSLWRLTLQRRPARLQAHAARVAIRAVRAPAP